MNMKGLNNVQLLTVYYNSLLTVVWILFFVIFVLAFMTFIFKWVGQQFEEQEDQSVANKNSKNTMRLTVRGESPKVSKNGTHSYPLGWYIAWYGLGFIWLIDGFLQSQPEMALPIFVKFVFNSVAQSQPGWLQHIMDFGITMWNQDTVGNNIAALLAQLAIGVGILTGRNHWWGRVAIWASLVWALIIWVMGEGLGNLFSSPSYWNGSPGAALIYMLISIYLLMPLRFWATGKIAKWTIAGLGIQWLILAFAQILPSNGYYSSDALYSIVANLSNMPQPIVLSNSLQVAALSMLHHPLLWNLVSVLIMIVIGVSGFFKRLRKFTLISAIAWLAFTWWIAEDFGVLGGMGTDLNMSPLYALLYISCWWYADRPVSFRKRIALPFLSHKLSAR
ncbi:hypothetical protein [Ferroacidibacillus organovorans]|uniref:Uncharacterized protein n=1 Tax=Ferroacidibacillus organovorans TaxID=1765683 RepID=A0A101XNV1_9BACL|nr:hypothetical protein [Ferroacidibacillus organovorans]KUO94734.1 hypothetical protein ATW55_09945 [Ferroacidibacillus organovorans]